MARVRFFAVALLALALAGNSNQTGKTAEQNGSPPGSPYSSAPRRSSPLTSAYPPAPSTSLGDAAPSANVTVADNGSCKIYALTDMGIDADFGTWIAQTIPSMIEPNSWTEQGGAGVLRYYAPKNVLIVNHSAAIQTKVEGFLKDLKTTAAKGSDSNSAAGKKTTRASVIPAEYREPTMLRTSQAVPETSSYPVPAPVKPPKHLFHFLIRYEGEGIIDDNVVKFWKTANPTQSAQTQPAACTPAGVAPVIANGPQDAVTGAAVGGSAETTKPKPYKQDNPKKESGAEPVPPS